MEVKDYIEKYGEEWCIAAIVDGSIGYYTPEEARRLIEEYKKGKRKCYSERCMALYGCDLEKMLESDFKRFAFLEKHNLTAPIIDKVKAWLDVETNISDVQDTVLGLMYPTL